MTTSSGAAPPNPAPGTRAQIAPDAEIELKLTVDRATMARLRGAPVIADHARNRGTVRRLESVYYDTPDHALYSRAMALRVRRSGKGFVQTLKTAEDGAGRSLGRGEWEVPVGSLAPDIAALTAPEAQAHLAELPSAPLKPVFATRIRREARMLDLPGAAAELALDEGTIETGQGTTDVAEIELELKTGRPGALYEFALRLLDHAPLRVGTRSKAERGYALAFDALPPISKGGRPKLGKATSLDEAIALILSHCLRHWTANEAAAEDGRQADGVHQMRVALRRLRSALALLRTVVPSPALDELRAEAKWLATSLGQARDWDVFLKTTLEDAAAASPHETGFVALRKAAEARRAEGYRAVRAALADPRCTRLHLTLGAWIERRGWRDGVSSETLGALVEPISVLADRLLARLHRKALEKGRHLGRLAPPERHELRIALKKLRYATDFFLQLYPEKPAKSYAAALAHLQDALGHLNDVAVATRLVGQATEGAADPGLHRAAGLVLGWHGRGAVENEPKLLADWDEFRETDPVRRSA